MVKIFVFRFDIGPYRYKKILIWNISLMKYFQKDKNLFDTIKNELTTNVGVTLSHLACIFC